VEPWDSDRDEPTQVERERIAPASLESYVSSGLALHGWPGVQSRQHRVRSRKVPP
jgi:hypothetical protein